MFAMATTLKATVALASHSPGTFNQARMYRAQDNDRESYSACSEQGDECRRPNNFPFSSTITQGICFRREFGRGHAHPYVGKREIGRYQHHEYEDSVPLGSSSRIKKGTEKNDIPSREHLPGKIPDGSLNDGRGHATGRGNPQPPWRPLSDRFRGSRSVRSSSVQS